VPVINAARRPGDPARLVADSALARKHLGWTPLYPDLSTIVSHAWNWEKKIAGG
jgi:UDP-glucose 4-epimerase